MSVPKLMLVTAVPFHLARLQSNAVKNIFQNTTSLGLTQTSSNGDAIISLPLNQRRTNAQPNISRIGLENTRVMKKRQKTKSRTYAQMSREKSKLQKQLLEQQLQNLKAEKMKLMKENEELRLLQSSLVEENLTLKKQWEWQGESGGGALEHASFVNIPLQKEWVLPQVFIIFLLALREIAAGCQIQEFLPFHQTQSLTFHFLKIYHLLNSYVKMLIVTAMKNQMFLFALSHKT